MLQPSTVTTLCACDDTEELLEDRPVEVTAPDSPLDEAGWQALLIQVDQEEGGP